MTTLFIIKRPDGEVSVSEENAETLVDEGELVYGGYRVTGSLIEHIYLPRGP